MLITDALCCGGLGDCLPSVRTSGHTQIPHSQGRVALPVQRVITISGLKILVPGIRTEKGNI